MKRTYITGNLQMVLLAQQKSTAGSSIHDELAQTIALHKQILQHYFSHIGLLQHRDNEKQLRLSDDLHRAATSQPATWLILPETNAA
jgi:predicted DNA-binding protein YlxM (UPF0122 family)